jgi:hypothetical protein
MNLVIDKIREKIRYQGKSTNCGNCLNASKEWNMNMGKCKVVPGISFTIFKEGVCKLHSSFNGE